MAQYNDPILIADAMGVLHFPQRARDNGTGIVEVKVCQPMCTPIRYHLLALLRPYRKIWDSIDMHTYAISITGARGVDGFTLGFDRQFIRMNVAELRMSRELAAWIEWLIYRHNATNRGTKYRFLSPPIKEYNLRWYANHQDLPEDWRQVGCDPTKEDLEEGAKNREAYYREREQRKKEQAKAKAKTKAQAKPEKARATPPPVKKKQRRSWWQL